jgi:voltage-gated potassium channel Kch
MWIIFPDDSFKIKWEMMISVVLIFTAVTTPLRLAFSESDDSTWTAVNNIVDALFGLDIIICFFTAYEDNNEELVYNRKTIALTYIKSWFFIDLMSIVPVSEFLDTGDFSNLARIARLPKLYRLIRMVKLIRIMKIVKERNNISKYLNDVLKVSVALERLSFFCFIFVMLVHIISCFWVIISTFEENENNLILRNGLMNYESVELYLACFYYTTVIVTTIGYGDITVKTPLE